MLLVEPCSIQHLEMLLAGKEKFLNEFGIFVAEDYELIPQLLQFSLKNLIEFVIGLKGAYFDACNGLFSSSLLV